MAFECISVNPDQVGDALHSEGCAFLFPLS